MGSRRRKIDFFEVNKNFSIFRMNVLELLESGSVTLIDANGCLGKTWASLDRHADTAIEKKEALKTLLASGLHEQGFLFRLKFDKLLFSGNSRKVILKEQAKPDASESSRLDSMRQSMPTILNPSSEVGNDETDSGDAFGDFSTPEKLISLTLPARKNESGRFE